MNDLAMRSVRDISISSALSLGYPINEELPLLDKDLKVVRTREEVAYRSLCLFCVVAVSNNSNSSLALDWVRSQGFLDSFTSKEIKYLENPNEGSRRKYLAQEECLWALAWSAGLHGKLDFSSYCDSSLATLFPSIREKESAKEFVRKVAAIDSNKIVASLDLSYCLHWAIADEELHRRFTPHDVDGYVVVERRRALEWLVCDADWDEIVLDT